MGVESPEQPEGGGPVHYQISITGRQAGAFFLMLLLALGLAFFFGMKTGAAARKGGDAVTQIASVSDLPVPTVAAEETGEKEPAQATEPPRLGFEETHPVPTSAPPTPTTVPTATPTSPPTATPTATPTHAPVAVPSALPARGLEKAAKGVTTKGWHVQAFATRDSKKADEWVKKLKREGLKADVSPAPKSSDLFVVRVGPYPDKARAESARKKIVKAHRELKDAKVVAP